MTNRQSIDGVFVIDKPGDWTSHDIVARVRKIIGTRRVGHTGTLDPFATGALAICINRATRLVQFMTGDEKEYLATMRLGFATDTGDLTGRPSTVQVDASGVNDADVEEAFRHFRGRIEQIPPMYSAKKIGGVKLYEMARRGETVERDPIAVEIRELELADDSCHTENRVDRPVAARFPANDETAVPTRDFRFRVVCSSGAYIRTLAEDIGKALGTGAHLRALRRTRAGLCDIKNAVTLGRLAALAESDRLETVLIPMADTLSMPAIQLSSDERKWAVSGRSIKRDGDWPDGARAMMCDEKKHLVAVAEFLAGEGLWHPRVVLQDQQSSG
jgi:tRNA pseudouridine55 synthase